jgi:methionyl-tRNA formyltransferase
VNAGLDTGEIVQQGEVPVNGRSLRKVWKEIESLGFELYLRAILEIKQGTASFQPASGRKGKLYRDPKLRDILAFWRKQVKGELLSFRKIFVAELFRKVAFHPKNIRK